MSFIFLDESGDLGFSNKSSKWFLLTMAIIQEKRSLERIVKKVWKSLRKKHKHIGELHASNEKDVTRVRIAKLLSECADLKIMVVILNKDKVFVDLQNQKHYLYNYAANILLGKLHEGNILSDSEDIDLVVDRKDTKKTIRDNFVEYISSPMEKARNGIFNVSLTTSHDDKSLQAVDFISWSIFRKYEYKDHKFYNLIKSKIIDESQLLP